jgi:dolichyl-diphosphooligosaccharide--protein glycosyltransferase
MGLGPLRSQSPHPADRLHRLPSNLLPRFDPWFNYRATEYLHKHGAGACGCPPRVVPCPHLLATECAALVACCPPAAKFFKWFDYMSWYPLGRPVGSTIYPGA